MATYPKSIETRQRIIDAMIQLIEERGYENVNVKSLSDYLDMPRSLVYYYYKNKQGIMHALYQMRYADTLSVVTSVMETEAEEDPLVRLLLIYVLFRRFMITNPIFTEYLLEDLTFASLSKDAMDDKIHDFYMDSKRAFEHYGLPTDTQLLFEHALTVDALSRAISQSVYSGTIKMKDEDIMSYLCERTIKITFKLTSAQMKEKIDKAFALSYKVDDVKSTYTVEE